MLKYIVVHNDRQETEYAVLNNLKLGIFLYGVYNLSEKSVHIFFEPVADADTSSFLTITSLSSAINNGRK